jgi:hypothetical protein
MALFVLLVFGGIKFIELFAKHIIPFAVGLITHKKKIPVEKILENDAAERKSWQDSICAKIEGMEKRIESLFSIVSDHEELFGPVSRGTLENMLFNDKSPTFRRLKSFLRLLAMDVNGRVKKTGMALILESEANKERWLDVLETMPKLNLKIANKEHFETVLNEINRRIYDGMMR